MEQELLKLKLKKAEALEEQLKLKEGLPFKYGFKLYEWQKSYCDAKFPEVNQTRRRFCTAANQIGKSSIQIIDRLEVATNPSLWPKLWPEKFSIQPNSIPYSWYIYPSLDIVMSEFEEKWIKDFLPRNEFKTHPQYGWTHKIKDKVLKYIEFNTGYRIYFKTYNQNVHDLQAGTVWAIDLDEETPYEIMPELEARLFGTDGHLSAVFTATRGQEEWRCVMEEIGSNREIYPNAFKRQISMYDCMKYHDGTSTLWTEERIKRKIDTCKSPQEVLRRIHGKFVKDSGLKYPSFNRERNFKKRPGGGKHLGPPAGWTVYSAVDYGSGGEDNHPSAIVFIAASPDLTKLRLFRGRRYDKIEMTAGDLFNEYKKLKGNMQCAVQSYDWSAKDFGTIAERAGEPFTKAQKDHDIGEQALSTALKTGMLVIYDDEEGEGEKLAREFETLGANTEKRKAKDDYIDATRYCVMSIPVDWDKILNGFQGKPKPNEHSEGTPEKERPNDFWETKRDQEDNNTQYQEEFEYWNDLL